MPLALPSPSEHPTRAQGGGEGAVVEDIQGATHGHALADAADGDAGGAQAFGEPVGGGGAVDGGAEGEDHFGDAAGLDAGQQ